MPFPDADAFGRSPGAVVPRHVAKTLPQVYFDIPGVDSDLKFFPATGIITPVIPYGDL
jgi:hypothetical protein